MVDRDEAEVDKPTLHSEVSRMGGRGWILIEQEGENLF
jgi:hypothetical protein